MVNRFTLAYERAQRITMPLGVPIDVAATEYAKARELLGGHGTLLEAVGYFRKHTRQDVKKGRVPDIVKEFNGQLEIDGRSARYRDDCRNRLATLAKKFDGEIADITMDELQDWLNRLKLAPRSRNNYRSLIITLFNFAKSRRYLPRDVSTEADGLTRAEAATSEIGILTPKQMKTLLGALEERLIPYVAIGGFAGLRQAEILRLEWSDVNFNQKIITVQAAKSKTASRRIVPIQPNLQTWLEPYRRNAGMVCSLKTTANMVTAAAKGKGIDWPNNALRHSFASYRLSACQDAAKVTLEMGNSPQMIFRHYRELVTPRQAAAWWKVNAE